ncbi:MAG TPA: phosphatase PAP2 family protein [Ktedonobacteraceae bacterium]|jgi:membrane-associated phospholipid phosphatase|nr:phosphatase PAP2 family protein [Ktedonobacteraceae bacterium]
MKSSLLKHSSVVWGILAGTFFVLFALYSYLVYKDHFVISTLQLQQQLVQRPLTGFDCILRQWRRLGEVPASLVILPGLCVLCWLLGYRKRVALVLLLLLGIGVGVEYVGKQVIAQPVPDALQRGLDTLGCPQDIHQSRVNHLELMLGLWWEAPPPTQWQMQLKEIGATVSLYDSSAFNDYGYPSGHAIRWLLIGLVACWLFWRQVRQRPLRWLLMLIAVLVAFGGGFAQFYIGAHLFTDMIGGYLMGLSLACCAIAFLSTNEGRSRFTRRDQCSLSIDRNSDTLVKTLGTDLVESG